MQIFFSPRESGEAKHWRAVGIGRNRTGIRFLSRTMNIMYAIPRMDGGNFVISSAAPEKKASLYRILLAWYSHLCYYDFAFREMCFWYVEQKPCAVSGVANTFYQRRRNTGSGAWTSMEPFPWDYTRTWFYLRPFLLHWLRLAWLPVRAIVYCILNIVYLWCALRAADFIF